ncbi:MAG: dihydroorotate dehydrogenase-like protein [Acidobacteria bacterium]|nr:MAG: dihydroorotate dehydrogenase-like protein [Acidobacteriota bacterium]
MDLRTSYLGCELKSPLVASASPLSEEIDNIRRMEDAGAGAVVLHSLFEEQIIRESEALHRSLSAGTESFAESLTYLPEIIHYKQVPDFGLPGRTPDMTRYNRGQEGYLEHVRRAAEAVGIPVIASLNATSPGGWVEYARRIEDAGATALELNIYFMPTDLNVTGSDIEKNYCDLVRQVKNTIRIPIAVKLGPYFSAMAHFAGKLDEAGADALVLFNRFYQPDFDIENLEVVPTVALSTSQELLLRLHWVAILYGRVRPDLAITGGVHTAEDVLKAMMAGARVAMMTSALLRNGIGHLQRIRGDLINWMEEHEYESVRQMQGSLALRSVPNPADFERANYMRVLGSYTLRSFSSPEMGSMSRE